MAGVRRPPKAILAAGSAALIVLGAAVAYRGLVLGVFEITTGPKGQPPVTVWAVQGRDASRIGAGGIALAAFGVVALVNAGLKSRTTWGWRFRVGLALALLTLATILFLPPWQVRLPGTSLPSMHSCSRHSPGRRVGACARWPSAWRRAWGSRSSQREGASITLGPPFPAA